VKYVGGEALHDFTLNLTPGATNFTANGQFQVISQGLAPNFAISFVMYSTVNADGTATAVVDSFQGACRG
jgi:hypothetical protein